jgi:hypothetical protein
VDYGLTLIDFRSTAASAGRRGGVKVREPQKHDPQPLRKIPDFDGETYGSLAAVVSEFKSSANRAWAEPRFLHDTVRRVLGNRAPARTHAAIRLPGS